MGTRIKATTLCSQCTRLPTGRCTRTARSCSRHPEVRTHRNPPNIAHTLPPRASQASPTAPTTAPPSPTVRERRKSPCLSISSDAHQSTHVPPPCHLQSRPLLAQSNCAPFPHFILIPNLPLCFPLSQLPRSRTGC